MKLFVKKLMLNNYRNIEKAEIIPNHGINLIYGENAQGKTNILEALWLFTGAKSFRGSKTDELIRFSSNYANINCVFDDGQRENTAVIKFAEKKQYLLNDIPTSSAATLTKKFYAVVFSPTHLSIVKGSPSLRRNFIDEAICQISPKYIKILSDFNRICFQRNNILKDIASSLAPADSLEVWDYYFCNLAAAVIHTRDNYIRQLQTEIQPIIEKISDSRDSVTMRYISTSTENSNDNLSALQLQVRTALDKIHYDEIHGRSVAVGPTRDDVEIMINGISARNFASQGQQRSIMLALKLSECGIIYTHTKQQPIVLLDDVMSELDARRQHQLIEYNRSRQTFMTSCERGLGEYGSVFHVKDGIVSSQAI